MKTRFTIGIVTVVVALIGLALGLWWKYQPEPSVNFEPVRCIYSDTILSGTAVPNWTTETRLEARKIDEEKFTPYEPLQELTVDEQPLAWTTGGGKVVVDDEIFSDLQFIDVIGFGGDSAPTVIGQVMETDLKDEEWRTLLEFLTKSHVVRTYVHLESELCLVEENNTETEYQAHFTAVHRYCTNDCYEDPFEFTVVVDKQSGDITLQ